MPRPVILPDTNVWIDLVESDAVESFRKEAKLLGLSIAACPAVVNELLRASLDPVAKKKRILTLTRGSWKRLMPEVFHETEEARNAISRVHPEWLNPTPDLRQWVKHKADWETAWWIRTRENPEGEAALMRKLEGGSVDQTQEDARLRRAFAQEARLSFDSLTFDYTAIPAGRPPSWWDGEPFEPWRAQFASVMLYGVTRDGNAIADWLAPWLKNRAFSEAEWYRMWLREATKDEMPLAWLRWAFEHVQATRKQTSGTPIDNQIATYLPECDFFLTGDKAFAECVEQVRPHSPIQLGRAIRLDGTASGGDAALDALRSIAS